MNTLANTAERRRCLGAYSASPHLRSRAGSARSECDVSTLRDRPQPGKNVRTLGVAVSGETPPAERRSTIRGGHLAAGLACAFLIFAALPILAQPLARGRIPNQSYPADELFTQISPQLSDRHHNQPTVVNGYLLLAGNGVHEFWDISNPYSPVRLSEMFSPHRSGEAESHQVSYARFPNGSMYLVTASGRGIDLWGIDDVRRPSLLSALELPNIDYGDLDNSVWGVAWQGDYIYVGATTSGLYVVDAGDPTQPSLLKTFPTNTLGGVAAGPLFALGNLLVITTPKSHAGVVTMDISDPANPVLLDFVAAPERSYIGSFYGGNAHLLNPFRTYDVTTDPRNIELIGSFVTPKSEYVSFGDGHLFLGGLRQGSQGIWKYGLGDPDDLVLIGRIPGRNEWWDDQFSVPIGNLIAIGDDQNVKGYVGSFMAVHATEPDTRPPVVEYVNPRNGAVGQPPSSRIGLSFSDQIELASVDSSTLIVRPIGGEAVTGKWGHTQTVVTFGPDQSLQAETDYEVIVPAGGITDLVGNSLASEFRSVFRTGTPAPPVVSGIEALNAAAPGRDASFTASHADQVSTSREYRWDFGDGERATGASVLHRYDRPGRYTVTLSVVGPGPPDIFEAEAATLSGGVAVASDHPGYSGAGFADFPAGTGPDVKVQWRIARNGAGVADVGVRYANGSGAARSLALVVNGILARTAQFEPTGSWRNWRTFAIGSVSLPSGDNTLELIAQGQSGPNVDRLSLSSETSAVLASYSAVQIVHGPLTAREPTRSTTVIVTADQSRVWSVNPDANTVTAVDTGSLSKAFETAVGTTPRTLAQAPDGAIWVVNEGSADISVLDSNSGEVIGTIDLPYASMPYGIAFAPNGLRGYVTLQALGRLLQVDPAARAVVRGLDLGPDATGVAPRVRGIAITADSGRILVTRFVSPEQGGAIYEIAGTSQNVALTRTIALAPDPGPDTPDSGRGIPNYLSSLAISPDGLHAWAPSKKDNIARGAYRDGHALTHDNAVRTVISRIDLASGREDLSARIDLNDQELAFAVASSRLGDLLFAAMQGSNVVSVIDANSGARIAGIPTGRAPQGLTLDDQGRLYVQNFMSRSLSVFDVAGLVAGTASTAPLLAEIALVAHETLAAEVLLGKQIFYDASSTDMSLEGYLSCASCHLDGGQDGRTWDFTDRGEGLRNTISLKGRAGTERHGPVHWTGNFDEIQDFENDIRFHFGGSGLMTDCDFNSGTRSDPLGDSKVGLSAELDALAAYVSSLDRVPPSPFRRSDGALTADGEVGKGVFASEGCGNCHQGAEFTDSALGVRHDVGTASPGSGGRLGGPFAGFDTPTLKGVWATPPYLHDGSAPTLADAITAHRDVAVSSTDLEALVSYVRQIDELEAASVANAVVTDATLSALSLSDVDIGTFSAAVTSYTAQVGYSVETTTVTATATRPTATVVVSPASPVSLEVGANAINVTVTAEDGTTTRTYTVTVTRPPGPLATIAPVASTVTEGTAAEFLLSLDEAATTALSVAVSVTESGAMLSGEPPASVSFSPGDTAVTLRVATAGDSVVEGNGTVTASLVAGAGYVVGAAASAAVTVLDDDTAALTLSAAGLRIEERESTTLTVEFSNGVTSSSDQTIELAVSGTASGSDYRGVPQSLTLAAGASSVTVTVMAVSDQEDEDDETLTVTASHDGGSIGAVTVTIVSVDPPMPNIVVILADDMGWGQPGFNGGTAVETPHMDRIADEGVKLTQFYVQPQCAPTRASLLTGRYPWKTGVGGLPNPERTAGMRLDERTMAQALGDAGYATWIVGKWHVGHWLREQLPLQRGFDHHYGLYTGHIRSYRHSRSAFEGWILDWHRNERPIVESGYATFLLADEAIQLIERHDGANPFFLYLSFNAVHSPYEAPQEYLDLYSGRRSRQRAMLKAMDVAIGQVLSALEEKGVLDDTLVMFFSDNGAPPEAWGAGPYRGRKATYFDGGMRAPAVLRWPDEIPAGSETDALLHVSDVFPTFAGLAGASTTGGLPLDGLDAWDAITNGADSPRTEILYSPQVIRSGDWKLIKAIAHTSKWVAGVQQLYNIAEDPYETANLAETETAKVAELRERLELNRPSRPEYEQGRAITASPVVVFGEEENAAFGTALQAALTERDAGNTGPVLDRLEVVGAEAKLTYDEALDAGSVPPASAFTVVLNPGYRGAEVEAVAVSGSAVELTLAEAPATSDTVGLTYDVPDANPIRDEDALEATGITWVTATPGAASVSADATLSGLSLSGVDIGTFSDTTVSYTATVDTGVTSTTVTATTAHAGATVAISPGATVPLSEGTNTITVTVTAEDGVTTQTYTVTVTRAGAPIATIAAVAGSVTEGSAAEFEVRLTEAATASLSVAVSVMESGAMLSGTPPASVSFSPGDTSAALTVTTAGDSVVEGDSSVTASLVAGSGYAVGASASASVTVADDDTAAFTVSLSPTKIGEGQSSTLTVAISNGVTFAADQTITLAATGAASASDYGGVPGSLTLVAGASSVTATVTAASDQEDEADETLVLTASHGGAVIGAATVTIQSPSSDATLSGLSLSGIDIGPFSSGVTTYASEVGIGVTSTTVTATANRSGAAVVISPGAEVDLAEGVNTITVTVTAEDGVTMQTYTVTVTRGGVPVVSVVAEAERVLGPVGRCRVSRTGSTAAPLEVRALLETSSGGDPQILTIQFPAGSASVTRGVQTGDNKLVEDEITVTWTLQPGEGYTVSAEEASASVVLEESDVPEFSVSVEPAGIAEGESATLTVSTTNGVRFGEAQTIALSFTGTASESDYTGVPSALTFPRLATTTDATLTAVEDVEPEGEETVTITAAHAGAEIGSASVTIAANEAAPPLTAEFLEMPETHDGETPFEFELRFSEEFPLGFRRLRDDAFEVTGGSVQRAKRLVKESNVGWTIRVAPSSAADVVVVLPVTTDCTAAGALCTAGGKALSTGLSATVVGPASQLMGFSLAPENGSPGGIWSAEGAAWVADVEDGKLYAYRLADGSRVPERDMATAPEPFGLWSDGETLWAAGLTGGLRAHRLADGSRLAERDLALSATGAPVGLWSDGETAWVTDWLGDTVHAYRLLDGVRIPERDIRLATGNLLPLGLWSDGQTLWVADWEERIYAYRLSDGRRQPDRDIGAGAGDEDPSGLWSGGGTLLTTSWRGREVQTYRLPAAASEDGAARADPQPGAGGGAGWEAAVPPVRDAALRAALSAALDGTGAVSLAGLEVLEARGRGIRSLVGLEGAVSLRELDLGFNPLEDVGALARLPSLVSLDLDGAAPDLTVLESLTGLERLSLRHNGIEDLSPLRRLGGLTALDLGANRIADLGPLATLSGLVELDLRSNHVRDLHALAGLQRLTVLRLDNNGVASLSPLRGLTSLAELGLAGGVPVDLQPLSGLAGLRRLDLRGAAGADLGPLRGLEALEWVHVGGSAIEDLTPLDGLKLTVSGRDDRESPKGEHAGRAREH